jgi:hypothetical protein
MKLFLCFLFLITFSSSCREPQPKFRVDSFVFGMGRKTGEIHNKKIFEASGIAASIANPGLLWIHNDSGNGAEVFLIDTTVNIKLTCTLEGISNRDWEDIAVGPGPDSAKSYIYVGEVGDNLSQHPVKVIYRFEEPKADSEHKSLIIKKVDRIVFRFPEGAKDCEAIMVDPLTRDLYAISKREKPVVVYKLDYPQNTKDTVIARKVATIKVKGIVAGDISGDGKEILVKNIKNVFYWIVKDGMSIEETLNTKPSVLPYKKEPQGEAIGFARDGSGYFTIGEKLMGERAHLRFYKRAKSDLLPLPATGANIEKGHGEHGDPVNPL